MKLSVVIPAHNEADSLSEMIHTLYEALVEAVIDHEIVVINDHSTDQTAAVLNDLKQHIPTLKAITNDGNQGFGWAIRKGLDLFSGDCVAIMMADLSDSPHDLVRFYHVMVKHKVDCVFGNRFVTGGKVQGYPPIKLLLNRMANYLVSFTFGLRYRDVTNAFKLYRRETITGLRPFLSPQFNLTLELPLKAIVRGYSYKIEPNSWQNRKHGQSNLRIKEMGSRYFFIYLYCLIEKYFSRGDYRKQIPRKSSKCPPRAVN